MGVNLAFIMQICGIVAGVIGLTIGIVNLFYPSWHTIRFFRAIFTCIISIAVILIEVYVFDFFKYFAFLFTYWGKGATYIFLGCSLWWANNWYHITGAVLLWVLAIVLIVFQFIKPGVAPPLVNPGVSFETASSDFYQSKESV